MNASLLKELLALLAAGAQIVPLADNDDVYRRLEQELDSLHEAERVTRDAPRRAA